MSVLDELNNLGNNILSDAIANVPVDTGALKSSLGYHIDFKSVDNFNITFTGEYYGKYVNDGTRYQSAQPFMTNAIENNLTEGTKHVATQLTNDMIAQLKINLKK